MPVVTATDFVVLASHDGLELEALASISVTFRSPVEETFELVSPPLK
jgi:hypothetical protein